MNKNRLLAGTALVSAALVMGAPDAQALSLKLGGFANFWFGYGDNKKVPGTVTDVRNNFDVKQEAEIWFTAEEKLNNGMTVGVLLEIEAGPGNALSSGSQSSSDGNIADTEWDRAFVWVKTPWGQVNIGNVEPAAAYVGNVDVVGAVLIIKSEAEHWVPGFHALLNMDNDLGFKDSQNITYFTPRIGGFQLIASYAPDNSDWHEGDFDRQETGLGEHNAFSVAAKFERKFGGIGVGLGAGWSVAEARDNPAPFKERLEGHNAALKLEIGSIRFTAGYNYENLFSRDERFWGVGLIYRINPVHEVSLGYGDGERLNTRGGPPFNVPNDDHVIAAGWRADLGKGVSVAASVFQWEADPEGTQFDAEGWGVAGGFSLRF